MLSEVVMPAALSGSTMVILVIEAILCLTFGAVGCWIVLRMLGKNRIVNAQQEAEKIAEQARREAEAIHRDGEVRAKEEFIKRNEQFEKQSGELREELRATERRLQKREDTLDRKLETLTHKERSIDQATEDVARREAEVAAKESQVDQLLAEQRDNLLRISKLSEEDAKAMLLERLDTDVNQEAAKLIEKRMSAAKEEAKQRSRDIVITAIQRYAAEHTCDSTVSAVDIPSDDMKGRVIGREGRNIRAFEKATGVDVIVDDTPGVVVVSSFDPIRREIARRSLEKLIQDGRIHPARIEELVENTGKELEQELTEIGKRAAMEANVMNLAPKAYELLGRLNFRTSYGQNVLRHSIEVAFLCQVMADELGLEGSTARRCGLLHDLGKAVDHEMEGGHPEIGATLGKRLKESDEVIEAISGHHGDGEIHSIYTPLVAAADAISASRPGARRESLERYIKRLEQLEGLALGFDGVSQAFAIQAGREVRVLVNANVVDDAGSVRVARDIAKRIEEEMTYPGEVKVTLLREVRAIEYAR